jgi:hypothetical protein
MAQVLTYQFASIKTAGTPPPPGSGTTLQDVIDMMYLSPLFSNGFGTHPTPLQINNTGLDWRTHARFGPTPFSTNNSGFVGYNFGFMNNWWQLARAQGFTDTSIRSASVEMECPRVSFRKNAVWSTAKTNPSTGTPQAIDGRASVLGTPNGGYFKTTNADGSANYAKVTDLTASTRTSFAAGSDVNGPYGDGHRIALASLVKSTGLPPSDGEPDVLHTFYPNAFFPRIPWPQNSDGSPGEVMIFSRARLVGPSGLDLRNVGVECALAGDLYEDPTQSSVGSTPGGASKNPPIALPVHRWLVDPGGPSSVTVRGPWVPMGGLMQVSKAGITTINTATPIPVLGM